jgi:predicted DsbA family dithiol-disulfide isomerase
MRTSPNGALAVEVWSDIACPWCWVGKHNLEAAVADLGIPVHVRWRAFELDPSAPPSDPEPADYVGRIAAKYGVSRGQAQDTIDRICQAGSDAGVAFRFDRIKPGNTFDAHRLLHLASEHAVQNELKERLFYAYLHEGLAISDHHVLAEAADDVGLPAASVAELLQSDQFADVVRRDEARAHQIGVTGVPFFVVGNRYALGGAQPPEVLRRALEQCLAEPPAAPAEALSS